MRAIKAHIRSVENTGKITKSMKLVATSKLRKVKNASEALSAYTDALNGVLRSLPAGVFAANPLASPVKEGSVCYVLLVGNRGLCGSYNDMVTKHFLYLLRDETRPAFAVICGVKGSEAAAACPVEVREFIPAMSDTPSVKDAKLLAEKLRAIWAEGSVSEICFVYQTYRSAISQVPGVKRLLPLPAREEAAPEEKIIIEPDAATVAEYLAGEYFLCTVYSVLLEAKTAEHSARMTAMAAASDNTDELVAELTLELNHARQTAITTEIAEITGGANAL